MMGEDSKIKTQLCSELEGLSAGMVLLGLPDELAWIIFIESKDACDLGKDHTHAHDSGF